MKLTSFLLCLVLQLGVGMLAHAEENHQDNNDCRSKKTLDEQKFCLALAHKDSTTCESIKGYEMRMHCLHQIAEFSHHTFNSYSTMKKAEESK
jgi:hypothetical protein